MARQARLKKEIEQLYSEPPPGIVVWPADDSLCSLMAQIVGPDDSPFESGTFLLTVSIPDRYPFEPPRVRFVSPTIPYHPNIDSEGRICLDTLKSQPQGSWSPSVNISTLLLTIRLLMGTPNADDGLMPDITEEYKRDRKTWFVKAKELTIQQADLPLPVPIAHKPILAPESKIETAKESIIESDDEEGSESDEDESESEDDGKIKRQKVG